MLDHHEPEDQDTDDYIPTYRDHTWGDLLDRLEAGIAHELARSAAVLEEEHLQPLAEQLAVMAKVLLGTAWEVYCDHAHGTG